MKSREKIWDRSERLSLGLIGWPVAHSHSPEIHLAAMREFNLRGDYRLYPVKPLPEGQADLTDLISKIRQGELHGLNITIPHKQVVGSFLDEVTDTALKIGAVNTIVQHQGSLIGENTDASGFLADLQRVFSWENIMDGDEKWVGNPHALVLGAGGAARAVVYALNSAGWQVTLAARRIKQAESLISSFHGTASSESLATINLKASELSDLINKITLIVNATPVGMSPDRDRSPWPEGLPLPPSAVVYDLVYNPAETHLMRTAREAGLMAANGMGMLVEQAALAFECWTGLAPSREFLLRKVLNQEV